MKGFCFSVFVSLMIFYVGCLQKNELNEDVWKEDVNIEKAPYAKYDEFQWHVHIYGIDSKSKIIHCSGALIHPHWIVTTISCVDKSEAWRVFYGSSQMEVVCESQLSKEAHRFETGGYALIRLNESINENSLSKPIDILPDSEEIITLNLVNLTGFTYKFQGHSVLKYVTVNITNIENCHNDTLLNNKTEDLKMYDDFCLLDNSSLFIDTPGCPVSYRNKYGQPNLLGFVKFYNFTKPYIYGISLVNHFEKIQEFVRNMAVNDTV